MSNENNMTVEEMARAMKLASPVVAGSDEALRNKALEYIAKALTEKKDEIIDANNADLEQAEKDGLPSNIIKRLKFGEAKISGVVKGINDLIKLPNPLGKMQMKRELDSDLLLIRETCPIGVIGVIFESRPDALVQISTLCIKSGNCAILKGGSEAINTNKKVFEIIKEAAIAAGFNKDALFNVHARSDISELLKCHDYVDLLIPRGSNAFVKYIMDNTKIPVMGHADGICHVYVDKSCDIENSVKVVVDSKTQYAAVCNAAETLLVHKDAAEDFLKALVPALKEKNVEVRGTEDVLKIVDCNKATEEDFKTEYLDLIISVKLVDSVDEAIDHINRYGSHHTDCILTTDDAAAERFMNLVDSAGVYRNCSTRFADGYRYGFGAEVGISTGKLHARGPVGLEGLCTYKYKMTGNYNIVADYEEGRKSYNFKDLI